jgi:redox-sensitive bicupin YhaK (pirin superfamily)
MANRRCWLTKVVKVNGNWTTRPVVFTPSGNLLTDRVLLEDREVPMKGTFVLEWWENGQRLRRRIGEEVTKAQTALTKQNMKMLAKASGVPVMEEEPDAKKHHFEIATKVYVSHLHSKQREDKTIRAIEQNLQFLQDTTGRVYVEDIQQSDVTEDFIQAGSGILHQEMPKGDRDSRMHGFQLWANLPSSLKMTDPRYQDIPSSAIPEVTDDDGTRVRIICGEFWGKKGPVEGVAADPNYLDVSVAPGHRKRLKIETTRNAFAYVFAGSGTFDDASDPRAVVTERVDKPQVPPVYDVGNQSLVLFDRGDEITVHAGDEGIRFLLVSGKPIEEPVAWYGPIVMNTQEQLREAMAELQDGSFIKHR